MAQVHKVVAVSDQTNADGEVFVGNEVPQAWSNVNGAFVQPGIAGGMSPQVHIGDSPWTNPITVRLFRRTANGLEPCQAGTDVHFTMVLFGQD